jgi:hypothetical protein
MLDPGPMKIEATARAKEFIVEHGGNVYVWSDETGFDHAATEPPDAPIAFVPVEAEGFTLHQATDIASPDWWRIEFHHLPREHVTATWDGGEFGPPGLFGLAP